MSMKERFSKAKRIGLFDSGLGGLSVLKQLLMLPENNAQSFHKEFVYFADTARCPYGGRSQSEIQNFVKQIVHWLSLNETDLVIMACNTSAALIEPAKRVEFALPMLDLLQSTAMSIKERGLKRIGVMSTKATANSRAFTHSIKEKLPEAEVFELACPDLVPLVESHKAKTREAVAALHPYLLELTSNNVEAIVYGCTHFPFLEESMRRVLSELNAGQIQLIDPAFFLRAELTLDMTTQQENSQFQLDFDQINRRCRFVTTGNIDSFASGIRTHLGLPLNQIEYVACEQLAMMSSSVSSDIPRLRRANCI